MKFTYYIVNEKNIVLASGFSTPKRALGWIIRNGGEWRTWYVVKKEIQS